MAAARGALIAPTRRKWRRLDEPGLELFGIRPEAGGFRAGSTIVHAGADAFAAACDWQLDARLRTVRLELTLSIPGVRRMTIERAGGGWVVDGRDRPDLAACEEIDLSATPFCNSLVLRLLNGPGELTALFVHLPSLELLPSRQRYLDLGDGRWRYIDLGVAHGFEATLKVDDQGLVTDYEGLFETID